MDITDDEWIARADHYQKHERRRINISRKVKQEILFVSVILISLIILGGPLNRESVIISTLSNTLARARRGGIYTFKDINTIPVSTRLIGNRSTVEVDGRQFSFYSISEIREMVALEDRQISYLEFRLLTYRGFDYWVVIDSLVMLPEGGSWLRRRYAWYARAQSLVHADITFSIRHAQPESENTSIFRRLMMGPSQTWWGPLAHAPRPNY